MEWHAPVSQLLLHLLGVRTCGRTPRLSDLRGPSRPAYPSSRGGPPRVGDPRIRLPPPGFLPPAPRAPSYQGSARGAALLRAPSQDAPPRCFSSSAAGSGPAARLPGGWPPHGPARKARTHLQSGRRRTGDRPCPHPGSAAGLRSLSGPPACPGLAVTPSLPDVGSPSGRRVRYARGCLPPRCSHSRGPSCPVRQLPPGASAFVL